MDSVINYLKVMIYNYMFQKNSENFFLPNIQKVFKIPIKYIFFSNFASAMFKHCDTISYFTEQLVSFFN